VGLYKSHFGRVERMGDEMDSESIDGEEIKGNTVKQQ